MDAAAVVGLVALDGRTRNGQLIALSGEDAAAVAPSIVVADGGILNGKAAALGFNAAAGTQIGTDVGGCFVVGYGYAVQGNIGFFTNGTDAAAAVAKGTRGKLAIIVDNDRGGTLCLVAADGAIGDSEGAVKAVDTTAQALVAVGSARRDVRSDVVLDFGLLHHLYGGVLRVDAAATGTSVIQNLGIGNGDMALVRNENAAACANRHIGAVLADLSGLIIPDDAVVDGNILAVLDMNAAALFAFVFLDDQVVQQNVGVPSVLDGNAAFGGTGNGTASDLHLLASVSLAVLAGGSVALLLGQVHVHVAFDLLAVQVQFDPLGNFDIALVVLLQDDLVAILGTVNSTL